jgi:G protein-coupled receptor 64/G protein-coupled receptor 126
MSLDAFYYAFAIPVGVIIMANLVIFVITVVSIFRRPQGLRSNQSKHKMAITNLQAAITSFVLLGEISICFKIAPPGNSMMIRKV